MEFPWHVTSEATKGILGAVDKIRNKERQGEDDLSIEKILHEESRIALTSGDVQSALEFLLTSAGLEIEQSGAPWAVTCLKIAEIYDSIGDKEKAFLYYSSAIDIERQRANAEAKEDIAGIIASAQKGLEGLGIGES